MTLLRVENVSKSFTMHLRGGLRLPVVAGVNFTLDPGECLVLGGPSGVGKSSILRMVWGNYAVDGGRILVRHGAGVADLASGDAQLVLRLRRDTIGYVSQFLRALPRLPAREVVAEPLIAKGVDRAAALTRAGEMLERLNLPPGLHDLPPATFSGGEKQRVNIARGFLTDHPVLLLDEPTASLDTENSAVVVAMIREKLAQGTGIIGIFHDLPVREAVGTRVLDVSAFSARAPYMKTSPA